MFVNCTGITIYEKTVINRSPAYIRHTTAPIYWQPSVKQTDGKDRTANTDVFVNIPVSASDYCPKLDDRVVKGIITDTTPPKDAYTVYGVRDLRYGSPRVQHVELDLG